MAELKTVPTRLSVDAFLKTVADDRRADCKTLVRLMKAATGDKPKMWGPSIVGFGEYNYKYDSGREGLWFKMGFSPRKNDLTLYIMPGIQRYKALLPKLGKHKTGVSCLYVKKLSDLDAGTLEQILASAARDLERERPKS